MTNKLILKTRTCERCDRYFQSPTRRGKVCNQCIKVYRDGKYIPRGKLKK